MRSSNHGGRNNSSSKEEIGVHQKVSLLVCLSLFVGLLCWISGLFAKEYKEEEGPYMDEVFHVPQAQVFCDFRFFDFHPLITTFPGLYLFAVGYSGISSVLSFSSSSLIEVCNSLVFLRSSNLFFSFGTLFVLFSLLVHHHPKEKNWHLLFLESLSGCLFPVLFLFNFLFYTDPGSVFFVLSMYYFSSTTTTTTKTQLGATLCGICAVLMRQNNWIWVAFALYILLVSDFLSTYHSTSPSSSSFPLLFQLVWKLVWHFFSNTCGLLKRHWGLFVVLAGFPVFLVMNKGHIVLGDKEAHSFVPHLAQLTYFLSLSFPYLFLSFLSSSSLSFVWRHYFGLIRQRCLMCLFLFSFFFVSSFWFRYDHPYLLADNRHYTFYLWRRVLQPYPLASSLLLSFASLLSSLTLMCSSLETCTDREKERNALWFLGFWLCAGLVLIPSRLLEFRYFLIPFFLLRYCSPLNARTRKTSLLSILTRILEFGMNGVFSSMVIYAFLYLPFLSPDSGSADSSTPIPLSRFMW